MKRGGRMKRWMAIEALVLALLATALAGLQWRARAEAAEAWARTVEEEAALWVAEAGGR